MSNLIRAIWTGDGQYPEAGSTGFACAASGFDDLESAECGAYLFFPDGDENGYYCDPRRDLVMEVN